MAFYNTVCATISRMNKQRVALRGRGALCLRALGEGVLLEALCANVFAVSAIGSELAIGDVVPEADAVA